MEVKNNLDRIPFPQLLEELAKYYNTVPIVEETKFYTKEDIIDAWEIGAREGLPFTARKREELFKKLKNENNN